MNDLLYAKQQLHFWQNKLDSWKMNGYDTPVMTYHEQLEEYEVRVQQMETKIKEETT